MQLSHFVIPCTISKEIVVLQFIAMVFGFTLVANAAAQTNHYVDPATFQCYKYSPVDSNVYWSNTLPNVALTHIFCGQIDDGEAEGFHSRPGNKDPKSAGAEDLNYSINNDVHCFEKEWVLDYQKDKKVYRKVPASGYFCFFPEGWNIATTVTNIQAATIFCQNAGEVDGTQICGRNYKNLGFDVIIFIKDANTVVTSFATAKNKVTCKVQCDLTNM